MKNRLKDLIDSLNISQKDFALNIGLKSAMISDVLSGRAKGFSNNSLIAIRNVYNVSIDWLLTGRGEMFVSDRQAGLPEQGQGDAGLSGSRRDRIIAALGAEEEEAINDYIEYRAARAGVDISLIKEATAVYDAGQPPTLPQTWDRDEDTVAVPVLGRIAAGAPMLAEENVETVLAIPKRWLSRRSSKPGKYFGLRVRGVSMLGAGILDGDLAVLSAVDSPLEETKSGDIVAALINGEATLKRISFEHGGRVILFPENPKFKPIELSEEDAVLVQGKLALLLREYGDEE